MKYLYNFIPSVLILILISQTAFAQVNFGVKGGLNLTSITTEAPYAGIEFRPRVYTGFLSQLKFTDKLYLRQELLYSLKGWGLKEVINGEPGRGSMNFHYVNLPILLGYRISPKFSMMAGPELGYLFKISRKPKPDPTDFLQNMYQKWDAGIAVGGVYHINEHLGAEIRFVHGIRGIVNYEWLMGRHGPGPSEQAFNKVWQIGLFYSFGSLRSSSKIKE